MSEPRRELSGSPKNMLNQVVLELISASSALNMQPEPLNVKSETGFLADTDKWAAHSYGHIQTAMLALMKIQENMLETPDGSLVAIPDKISLED